uniref:DH domain-containing protein n=1 Tax=Angiostrongylus cantonensis TaxID=6313 RepID=A0A0K0DP90_ANGCA
MYNLMKRFLESKAKLESEYLTKLVLLKMERKERESKHQEETANHDLANSDDNQSSDSIASFSNGTATTSAILTETTSTVVPTERERQADNMTRDQQLKVSINTEAKNGHDKIEKIESKVLSILSNTVKEQEEMLGRQSAVESSAVKADKGQNITSKLQQAQNILFKSPSPQSETTVVFPSKLELNITNEPERNLESENPMHVNNESNLLRKSFKKSVFNNDLSEDNSKHSQNTVSADYPLSDVPKVLKATEANEVSLLNETHLNAKKAEDLLDSNEIKRLQEHIRAKLLALLQKRVEKLVADLDLDHNSTFAPTMGIEEATSTRSSSIPRTSVTAIVTSTMATTTAKSTGGDNSTLTTDEEGGVAFKQISMLEEKDTVETVNNASSIITAELSNSSAIVHKSETATSTKSEAKLANVITPIAKIIDNIGPIIAPLLRSRTAARKAAGVTSYEPPGRDILAHSAGENSIIGYGTQLAREILNPGSLQKDREERQKAFAAKIAQIKENFKYNTSETAIRIPPYPDLYSVVAQTSQVTHRRHAYPQAFARVASVPLAEQAAKATRSTHTQLAKASFDFSHPTVVPYFTAPLTGYRGSLPQPTSPHQSLSTLPYYSLEPRKEAFSPRLPRVSSSEINAAAQSIASTPFYPTMKSDEVVLPFLTSAFSTQKSQLQPPVTAMQMEKQGINDNTGYERGRSEVKSTFIGDSGIMLGNREAPALSQRTDSQPSIPSQSVRFRGGGFGGGRRPTESFVQDASTIEESFSIFATNPKKVMKKR